MIRQKVSRTDRHAYGDAIEARTDLELVFSNAMSFNEEGSQIHENAKLLRVRTTS